MKKLLTVLLAFVMLFSLCAGAITLDTAESAAEVAVEEAVAQVMEESALDIPTSDPYYGELVYYNNFEEASGFSVGDSVISEAKRNLFTYKNDDYVGLMKMGNGGVASSMTVVKLANETNSENQALEIVPASADSFPQLYFDSGYMEKKGIFTFVADMRTKTGNLNISFGWMQNGSGRNDKAIGTANPSSWTRGAREYKLVTRHDAIAQGATQTNSKWSKDPVFSLGTAGMFFLNVPANATAANYTFYLDNIKIYFREYPEYVMNATEGYTYNFGFGKALNMEKTVVDLGNTEAVVTLDAETGKGSVKSAGYAGVVTINAVFTDGTTDTKIVRLYSGTKWKPGLNVYTGTTDPVDFDKVAQTDYNKVFAGSAVLAENPDKNGNDSNVIAYVQSQFNYLTNAATLATPIELARTTYFAYDVKTNKSQYVVINGGGGNNLYTTPGASTSWVKKTFNINLANSKGGMSNNTWGNGISYIGVGGVSGTYGYEDTAKSYQYFDNLELIPYYKATYRNWNDTADFNYQYFLKDSDGNLMTVYTPYTKNTLAAPWEGEGYKEFIGWSTTKGATEPMTSIPLAYKDLVLFPVYKDTTAAATNLVLSGATGKTGGVFFNKKLDMDATTVNVGITEATYAHNKANDCIVIAGGGYSGIVTINAVFFDGTTATVEVQLLGGEKWKPGLNLITGTTDTFGLDGLTASQVTSLALTFDRGVSVAENPVATGANTSNSVIKMSGEGGVVFPIFDTKMTQVIEKERGVLVKYDYIGNFNMLWIISQPNKIYADHSGALSKNAADWKSIASYARNPASLDFSYTRFQTKSAEDNGTNPKTMYLDNIAWIPAYKFTYVMPDGTEEYDYKITDANGNIITTYTPNKTAEWTDESKKFVGWKVEGTDEVVETVALANADITFIPVFEDLNAVNYYGFDGEVVKTVYVDDGEYTLGFVLEDENGKYFEGWKVEGTEDAVSSVNVTADVNLYPVYTDKTEALETIEEQEMRFDSENATAAIRFKSSITAAEKHEANEFGFIVTRKTYLDKMAELAASDNTLETELTFDFKYNGDDLFVSGVAYAKDENGDVTTEKIVEETADGDSVFAAVLTGIKNTNADHVNETMVVRPYVKFTKDGDEYVFYGAAMSNSLVGVAKSVDTSSLPENVKNNIDAIIALEKTAE